VRLLIDRQQVTPSVVTSGTQTIVARFRVSACSGRPVQGALVYVTAVPFVQFSVPPEATTGADGWAELRMNRLRGYPASPKQQLPAEFSPTCFQRVLRLRRASGRRPRSHTLVAT